MQKTKGFTLIELLVAIAIIAILATIVIFAVGRARMKAKDAAVMSSLTSFRNTIELEFAGDYDDLCYSDSFYEMADYVESQGGEILDCQGENDDYVIISVLPSGNESSIGYFVNTAFAQRIVDVNVEEEAQMETGINKGGMFANEARSSFCINSHGTASKIALADYMRLQGFTRAVSMAEAGLQQSEALLLKSLEEDKGTRVYSEGMVLGDSTVYGQTETALATTTSTMATASFVNVGGRNFMSGSFCTPDDLARAMNVEVSEVLEAMENMSSPIGGGWGDDDHEDYSDRYEYTCIEDEETGEYTGEYGCYDYDEDMEVGVNVCDENNGYPTSCGGGAHQVIVIEKPLNPWPEYSETYEYTCLDNETGELGCYDFENDEDVGVEMCDNDNAMPIQCGPRGGAVSVPLL